MSEDRYRRTIVKCPNCGEEIGRGDNLGITSALCAKCSEELFPQFKKDPVPPAPLPPWPGVGVRLPQELKSVMLPPDESSAGMPTIAVYANEEPVKKVKKKKPQGKSVSKVIKSLTRLK